jgi:deazaflavin-dependent oxidoreductase (nitroreductase family)
VARPYRLTGLRRVGNVLMTALLRAGVAPAHTYLLTVVGRKSGRRYSTPVRLVEDAQTRWLVSPYGERAWVANARAAGVVELSRGRRIERLRIEEVGPEEAAPVLRRYVEEVGSVVHPFFDASPGDPVEAFAAEAHAHPVFRLTACD